MSNHLCITLGHNSSAILIRKGKIICGYENERLSKIKSDSQFPALAIEECLKYDNDEEVSDVYISHWATIGEVSSLSNKYYDPSYLICRFATSEFHTCNKDFSHHDAHYYSAKCFAGKEYNEDFAIVADGFGNFGETISIYYKGKLIKRVFGYSSSLGLLYQYATAYLDLKMHQDEYKLLGYETHISQHVNKNTRKQIEKDIEKISQIIQKEIDGLVPVYKYDPVYSLNSLPALRIKYKGMFDTIIKNIEKITSFKLHKNSKKVIISYIAQSVIETIILGLIKRYNMKKVLLSGGLFLNVKLNNEISKITDEVCITPLCGDQGAALGLYYYKQPNLEINDLFWGRREIISNELDTNIIYAQKGNFSKIILDALSNNQIINIVHGNMEFGPRALCNTSTIALPYKENAQYINMVNYRENIMPMAPVLIDYNSYFKRRKIHRSTEFMVIAQDYNDNIKHLEAVSHPYYDTKILTGRPQVIKRNHILYDVVNRYRVLINTSFNIHGTPIVYSTKDINKAYNYQKERDYLGRIITVVM